MERKEDLWSLKRKHSYYGQVQFGMALLNLKSTDLIIYSSASDSFCNINVDFDEEFAKHLILRVNDIYFKSMIHFYCINKNKYEK